MFSDFTIANAVQILLVLGGFVATIVTLRVTVRFLRSDIVGIQREIEKIGQILVNQADMRGEIKVLESRVTNAEQALHAVQNRCEREHFARAS
jgi:hypothetical protein